MALGDIVKELITLEAHEQGVDPRWAIAVATQESYLNPRAVGDKGRSVGLFQLQPAAAQDVGLSAQDRYIPSRNIHGGVAYLKRQLDREGGNVERALSRYNRGTPTYQGIGDPHYVENVTRHYQRSAPVPRQARMTRVRQAVNPGSAEAATMPTTPNRQALEEELRALEAYEAQQSPPSQTSGQVPAAATAPPPGTPQVPWWQQAAGSAARTASRGILGGLPELAGPAVQQMTDPQQIPQTAAGVGELVGQQVGSAVMPGAGTAVGGTLGAVAGLTAGTLASEGRLPSWKEVGKEAVWSALPEVGESALRGVARVVGRGTQGGRLIRLDEAARRARALPGVFQSQTRQQVGQAFDAVRASGVQLDVGPIRQEVQALRPGKYADLLAEVQRIDRQHRTGRRYQQIVERLRQGGGVQVAGLPVGDLQDLRSHLRARAEGLTSFEARQLVEDFQGAVDDAIDQGIARGRAPTGMTVADLQEARRQWARVRAHDDLSTLVERTVTTTPDLTMSSLNLRQLADALRRNESPLARRINRSMDHTPGARAAFQREIDDLSTLFQTVELPMADVFGLWRAPGFAGFRQLISGALASQHGRQIFRDAIIEGRGRLSVNALAAAVNAARRESGLELPEIPGLEEAERGGATPTTPPGGG